MEYRAPEIVRVADAQAATLGGPSPVADRPAEGYFDPSAAARYPGDLLDV